MMKSKYESTAHVHNFVPSDLTITTTTSNINGRDLYIKSLEKTLQELLTTAHECTHATPGNADTLATVYQELDMHNKQFDVLMKQNASLLMALSIMGARNTHKGDGSSGNGGSSKNGKQHCKNKAKCPS
jgi:hypothetical protein